MERLDRGHKWTQIVTSILTVLIAVWIGVSVQGQRLDLQGQQTAIQSQTKVIQEQQLATQKQLASLQQQDICLRNLEAFIKGKSRFNADPTSSEAFETSFLEIAQSCGYERFIQVLSGTLETASELAAEKKKNRTAASLKEPFDGYVAIGNPRGKYNFYREGTSQPPFSEGFVIDKGAKLQTRWAVNIRENTSDTEKGENAIVDTLPLGACVATTEESLKIRDQSWSKVKIVDC